jgi:hypothetical protein
MTTLLTSTTGKKVTGDIPSSIFFIAANAIAVATIDLGSLDDHHCSESVN